MRKVLLLLAVLSSPALAQVRPTPTSSDPMQQSVAYAAGETVILETAPGFQVTVELNPDEIIQTAVVGSGSRWDVVAPTGSQQFFVRPSAGAASTNLSIVTDRRTYSFLLVPASTMTHRNPLMVRFAYPSEAASAGVDTNNPAAPVGTYRTTGSAALRPTRIWDDGAKTYLEWPAQAELPAVFAVGPDNGEMLVNGFVRDGRYVIDAVHTRLVFRLDRLVAKAERKGAGK